MESPGRSVFGEFANQFHGGFKSKSWGFRNKYPFRQGSIALVRWDRRQSGRSNWNQRPGSKLWEFSQMAIAMLKRSKQIQAVFSEACHGIDGIGCLKLWGTSKAISSTGLTGPTLRIRTIAGVFHGGNCAMIQSEIMDPYGYLLLPLPSQYLL